MSTTTSTTTTHYHATTPQAVRDILDSSRRNGTRVRLFYGDTATGKSWHEENDVAGTVGRSGGTHPIPLLIASSRSTGGPGILDHCIIAIATKGGWAYRHPALDLGQWAARAIDPASEPEATQGYHTEVLVDGVAHARFKGPNSLAKADRYIAFMTGKRLTK